MDNLAIVVQGQSNHVRLMKKHLTGHNVIYSAWTGEESEYSDKDIVIFNEIPKHSGPANFNFQKISTTSGLKKAKELGFKKALKLRSDLVPTNSNKFLKLLDNNDLNFLCWHCHEVYPKCPGYLVDYLMSGDIDHLIELYDIKDTSWCVVPEIHLTQQYTSKLMDKVGINFFLSELNSDNDLFWGKYNIKLSSYQNHPPYNFYKKYEFNESKKHLKEGYSSFLVG